MRKIRPEFFVLEIMGKIDRTDILELHGAVLLDAYSLQVKDQNLHEYIKASIEFWDEMPERAYSDTSMIIAAFKGKK